MIVSERMPDGTDRTLTPEEAREWNKEFGLSEVDQNFIRAIEAGEIDGDCIIVDDDGNEVRIVPTPDSSRQDQVIREAMSEAVSPVTKGRVQ